MRKIKFRAWDKNNERIVDSNDLAVTLNGLDLWLLDPIYKDEFAIVVKNDFVVEQYTGLKDKNGTDIYECDIIKIPTHYIMYGTDIDDWSDDYALVEWSEEYGGFFIYGETALWGVLFEGHPRDGFYHKFPEVVGNIHENSELLEGDGNE